MLEREKYIEKQKKKLKQGMKMEVQKSGQRRGTSVNL